MQIQSIKQKKDKIRELKEKQRRFSTDPEFVEQVARGNKRVRPDELIFVFEREPEH